MQSERWVVSSKCGVMDMGESNFQKEEKPHASEVEEDKDLMGSSCMGTRS